MDFAGMKELIMDIKIGESKAVYSFSNGITLYVHRPEKVGRSVKGKYSVEKNFQIVMKEPNKKDFLPNHLRVLLDLHLKNKSNPDSAKLIFDVIEKIYDGEDPLNYEKDLKKIKFDMYLDSALVNVCLTQLFMIEQEINYTHGRVKPPRAYIMGYIRMIRTAEFEIDKLLWSSTRHPPRMEFREKPNQSKLSSL